MFVVVWGSVVSEWQVLLLKASKAKFHRLMYAMMKSLHLILKMLAFERF